MQQQQATQSQTDPHPPESGMPLSKDQPPQEGLDTDRRDSLGHTDTRGCTPSESFAAKCFSFQMIIAFENAPWVILTEEMKLDAVVVTVALAEEEQCLSALEKKAHMTALQESSRPAHSSRRGSSSCTREERGQLCSLGFTSGSLPS
ncbi:hypothetical protein CesoFtcFv8_013249 [Champsocephalus esox]|uniref:Uncharacterized protein n=1 Tax=Champsocephalus esox TaxID=159716 RepID=A0AAN8C0I5_9TELE|nr:hypothetical protein CesoFtcFv8_013249 [Champsocephalus esox]